MRVLWTLGFPSGSATCSHHRTTGKEHRELCGKCEGAGLEVQIMETHALLLRRGHAAQTPRVWEMQFDWWPDRKVAL